ncbi:MAG: Spy/CpxP family protein refolding chaperone [Alphaproteobacteria bacterium]
MPYALDRPVIRPRRPAAPWALAGAVLILSLGIAADSATAQTQSPAAQKPGAATRQTAPASDPVDAKLAEIKQRLNITAAQQPQFESFANVVKQNAQAMEVLMQKAQKDARQNAVESLRMAASFAQTEADNLKRLVPALETLYASLLEQQKQTADRLFTAAPPSGPAARGEPQGRRPG